MKAKVAFVLRLIDDYSGNVIQREAFQFLDDQNLIKPIVKDEGMFVFLEPLPEMLTLKVIGTNYYEKDIVVEKTKLNPMEPILDVRLFGKPGKPHPYRCELYTGMIDDKKVTHPAVVCAKKAKPTGLVLKSVRSENGKQFVSFSGFTQENLVEKTYMLGEKSKAEVFIIKEKCGINEYCVEGNFTKKHDAGEKLHRTYRSVTDVKGGYAIPVESRNEDFIAEVIVLQGT